MAERHVGWGQTYATVALALVAAANGDEIIIHADVPGGAKTFGQNAVLTINQTDLTIRSEVGDTITIAPIGWIDYIFQLYGQTPTVRGLQFALAGGNIIQAYLRAGNGINDGEIDNCGIVVGGGVEGLHCKMGNVTGWLIHDSQFSGVGNGMDVPSFGGEIRSCSFDVTGKGIDNAYNSLIVINRCLFHGGTWGVYELRDGGIVKNSIFYECSTAGINCDGICVSGGVMNCTFEDCVDGIEFDGDNYIHRIDNCAFVNCSGFGINHGATIHTPNAPRNNLFFGNGTDFQNYTAPVDSQTTDPQFTDEAGHDYTFLAGSPLEDNGFGLGGIVDFDYVGTARPQGAAWDIGAYELETGWSGDYCGASISDYCGALILDYCGG